MKAMKVGIATREEIQKRTIDIAAGRLKPKASDPKIWFTSIRSASALLSEENRALLKTIDKEQPDSVVELAELTGRKQSNLSRTLNTMSKYGFVELRKLDRKVKPIAKTTKFLIEAA